jgi:hypothetical protein
MHQIRNNQTDTYQIRLKGVLDPSISDWLGDITILPQQHGETLLIGKFTDQAALRGFLDSLWNLNFSIISVEKIKNGKDQDDDL